MTGIQFENVTKRFGDVVAVEDISIDIRDDELLVLVGPSGCGKTTTLRMIAGLEFPSEGRVYIGGEDVTELAPRNRNIAMVFQDLGLFPHLNVRQNMSFGLKMRGHPEDEIDARVEEAAETLRISELIDRDIGELSGGQQQRVALGRAIVRDPQVFLLDEPLGALDANLRQEMRTEILELHKKIGRAMVYVTHDQEIAMTLGDRIAVMNDGKIQQLDEPTTVYKSPANLFVAQFIGSPDMNIFDATVTVDGSTYIETDTFDLELSASDGDYSNLDGRSVVAGIRPQDIYHADYAADEMKGNPSITTTANIVEDLGSVSDVHFDRGETEFIARIDTSTDIDVGDELELLFDTNSLLLFDPDSGERITVPQQRMREEI